jgi:hypothetical protein
LRQELQNASTVEERDQISLKLMRLASDSLPEEVCRDRRTDYGYDAELAGYRFPKPLSVETKAVLRAIAEEANRPADRGEILEGLKSVSLTMPHQGDVTDSGVWMEMVWMAVEEFPADVINASLRNLVKREKWRPAPAEVLEECHQVGRRRRALLKLSCPPQ